MPETLTVTMVATDTLTHLDGVPVRLWEGTTADGVRCRVFVHRIAVREDADTTAFDRALQERLPPGRFLPLSMIL